MRRSPPAPTNTLDLITAVTARHRGSISTAIPSSSPCCRAQGKQELLGHSARYSAEMGIQACTLPSPPRLGLGHAVLCARPVFATLLMVIERRLIDAEVPCSRDGRRICRRIGQRVLFGVQNVPKQDTDKYGIVSGRAKSHSHRQDVASLKSPSRRNAASTLAVVGRYLLTPGSSTIDRRSARCRRQRYRYRRNAQLRQREIGVCLRFEGTRYACGSKLGSLQATSS